MGNLGRVIVLGLGVVLASSCASKEESTSGKSVSGEVTPQLGGTVSTESGASVLVPAGSVTETEILQIAAEGSERIVAALPPNAGQPYAFTPHGTTFAKPVTITVPAVAGATQVLRLDDEQDATWEVVEGVTFANGMATFQSNHFCIYITAPRDNAGSGGASGTGGASATTGGATVAVGGAANGGATSTGGSSATTGGTTAKGGNTSTGGTTSAGGTTAKGGSTSTGGTTATGTNTSGVGTKFCDTSDAAPTACYTNGMAACSTSITACCADAGCSFGLTCTLAGTYGEAACISDGGAASKALFQTAKACLVAANAGCPLTATSAAL